MKEMVLFTLKNRRFIEVMLTPIKYVKEFFKEEKNNLFSITMADKSRNKSSHCCLVGALFSKLVMSDIRKIL